MLQGEGPSTSEEGEETVGVGEGLRKEGDVTQVFLCN